MNRIASATKPLLLSMAALALALMPGCKGGQDPILGGGGTVAFPPTITSVTPLPNATSVSINSPNITATFSETMAPFTGSATFTLSGGTPGLIPLGTAAFDGTSRIATYTLTSGTSLAPLTSYTATITEARSLTTGLALASPYSWSFTTGPIPDTTRPRVTLTVPATTIPGPTLNVATNTAITAAFTEDMAPASITAAGTFTVTGPGTNAVAGTVTYASRTAVFTPPSGLAADTTYTATLSTAATDLAGNALAGNQSALITVASSYIWTFRTGPVPDTTRPRVTLTVPATTIPGPTPGVPLNTAITAAFTEDMAPATIVAAGTFTLAGPGTTAVSGIVTYASRTAVFTPPASLTANTTYTATITTAATDLAGNALAGNQGPLPGASSYVWTFTTGPVLDTVRPRVTFTVPATTIPGPTTGVPINTAITAAFTKDMAPATLTVASFTVTAPGSNAVLGSVTYASRVAIFTPSALLATNTTYTATVTSAATDLAGNALAGNQAPLPDASNYVWTFTTGPALDTTRPRVTFTVPATTHPGPTYGVATNTAITASFTEDMAPATLNTVTFTLTAPGLTPVLGSVQYASRTAIFTPSAILAINTLYTATITTGATDLAGNELAGNQSALLDQASYYIWTFQTGPAPDTTRPRVTLTVPATTIPGPTLNVPTNTAITASFTEAMAPLTLNLATFKLTGPGTTVVLGGVSYATQTAVFTPSSVLAGDTVYTATVTQAATDVAGNALAGNQAPLPGPSDYVWTFRTSVPVPPANVSVLSTNPAPGALGVCPTDSINATFDVPSGLKMDPLTVNAATFTVTGPGPAFTPVIAASVSLDILTGRIATFTPLNPLTVGDVYTAKIFGGPAGVKDLAIPANGMLADFSWTFTVGVCTPPPPPNPLGTAATFGIMATAAITNTGPSIINGDVSLDPGTSLTGFPPGIINGTYHNLDSVSAQARIDLLTAYNTFKTMPPGTTILPGVDLGQLYLTGIPPGTYTSGSTMTVSTPLVLDAGGNPNAIWVFQIGSSLTTNVAGNMSLLGGAQAKNIFWVSTADVTVGVGLTFYGTIITGADATGKTGAVIHGRILAGAITGGTIALDSNTVNVPAP